MKELFLLSLMMLLLSACGSGDPRDRLRKLETERDELDQQITRLKAEIAGTAEGMHVRMLHVDIRPVQPGLFKHFIKVQGTVESDNNIMIPARASGVVKKIYFQPGVQVEKGTILAELDGAILENTLAELEVNMEMAKTMYERQKRLWEQKIGSEIQYLQAKTSKESLEKRLAATREQYQMTKVIAPINGTVDEVLLKEGEMAVAGTGAIRIVQLSALKISAGISEEFIGQIHKGDSVIVRFPALGRDLFSTIRSVSRVIDPKNRTFPIEIGLPQKGTDIRPNMLCVLTINDYTNPGALTVPLNVVQKTGISKFLFTAGQQAGGDSLWQVERRTVQTGRTYEDRVEITDGLKAGEFIVSTGFQKLADRQVVVVNQE
jgi:membrane fusion protein (multidrug efflux system)